MRLGTILFLSLFLITTTTSTYASNVLLPACENDSCSGPNLGLGTNADSNGAKPADNAAAVPAPAPQPSAATRILDKISNILPNLGLGSPKNQPDNPALPTEKKPVVSNISPGGNIAAGASTETQRASAALKTLNLSPRSLSTPSDPLLKRIHDEADKSRNRAPVILNDIDVAIFDTPQSSEYPYAISIALTPAYTWGARDVEIINTAFGYSPDQISAHCQLRFDGKITTVEGLVSMRVYAGQSNTVRYPGALQSVYFVPRAVCEAPSQLPQSGRIITRVGTMFAVQLPNNVTCNLPTKASSSLEILYQGDGMADCKYN